MRMKRWESPRREGRNDKGKKRSARQRQIKKQTQVWRKKLKGDSPTNVPSKQFNELNDRNNNIRREGVGKYRSFYFVGWLEIFSFSVSFIKSC